MSIKTRKQYPGLARKRYRMRREIYENSEVDGIFTGNGVQTEDNTEELKKQIRQANDQILRARADYENLRKRMKNQQKQTHASAVEQVIQPLLTVLDHFTLALQNSSNATNVESFIEGMDMIYREFVKVLGDIGLDEIAAEGQEFNPHLHEAVGIVENNDVDDNTVIAEVRKGYMLGDKVIRPTLCHVSKNLSK